MSASKNNKASTPTGKSASAGGPSTPTMKSTPVAAATSTPTPATPATPVAASAATVNPSFTPLLPTPSSLVPGATLHVTTRTGAEFDGVLHAYDAAAELLVVELTYEFDSPLSYHDRPAQQLTSVQQAAEKAAKGEGPRDYTLVHARHARIEVTAPPTDTAASSSRTLAPLSIPTITDKVRENQNTRREDMQAIGIGVAPEVQKLFDAIRKTTPCAWSSDYQSFIVLDSVRVSAPYTSAACTSVQNAATVGAPTKKTQTQQAALEVMLTRVKKIVDGERAKLRL